MYPLSHSKYLISFLKDDLLVHSMSQSYCMRGLSDLGCRLSALYLEYFIRRSLFGDRESGFLFFKVLSDEIFGNGERMVRDGKKFAIDKL